MGSFLPSLSAEVKKIILEMVMSSDEPVNLSFFLDKIMMKSPDKSIIWSAWSCKRCGSMINHKTEDAHHKDWIIANSVSRTFRGWGKEAFFSQKIFSITPQLLQQLRNGNVKNFAAENTGLLFRYAGRINVLLPSSDTPAPFFALPKYHRFGRLRVLAIHPGALLGGEPIESNCKTPSGTTKRVPASTKLISLLGGIGIRVGEVRVEVTRSVDDEEWRLEEERMKKGVFPVLEWTGYALQRQAMGHHSHQG